VSPDLRCAYTQAQACDAKPLNHSTLAFGHRGLVDSSSSCSTQIAKHYYLAQQDAQPEPANLGESAALRPIAPSVRSHAWVGNVILLGSAYVDLPNFWVDETHLVRSAVYRLATFWSESEQRQALRKVFNRRAREEVECLADIDNLILNKAFAASVPLRPFNQHRIAVFEATGRVPLKESETLSGENWAILLYSLGFSIGAGDVFAQNLDIGYLEGELLKMQSYFQSHHLQLEDYPNDFHEPH
jgi:hypothetical protein